jgi:putative transposase
VAVAAIKGEKTLIELAQDFDRRPNQIKQWRDQLLEGATGVFGAATKPDAEPAIDAATLHAKIGELALGHDFLSGALGKAGLLSRCTATHARMCESGAQENDRSHIKAQRQPPGHRAGDQPRQRHCQARPVSDADRHLMHRMDNLHTEFPFAGARMLRGLPARDGFQVGRLHVATLTRRMGVEALYRRPNTMSPAPAHKIYPYLLRKLPITRPNQVWAMDIAYIPPLGGLLRNRLPIAWQGIENA